jgi:hypothetical protein
MAFGSVFWVPQASLAESGDPKPTEQELRKFTKALVENVRTRQHVLNLLDHADASTEAIEVIGADLEMRLPDGLELPKATLVQDEVVIDGKPSGLKIVSYAPFKIKYGGRFWSANSRRTLDENYLELVRYFEEGSKPAKKSKARARDVVFDLFLPEAQAFMGGGALMGGMFGAMAGVMLTMGASPASGMMGMMMGFAVGGVIGSLIDQKKEREEREERRRRRLERRGTVN